MLSQLSHSSLRHTCSRVGHGRTLPLPITMLFEGLPSFWGFCILPPDNAATAEGHSIKWILGSWKCSLPRCDRSHQPWKMCPSPLRSRHISSVFLSLQHLMCLFLLLPPG